MRPLFSLPHDTRIPFMRLRRITIGLATVLSVLSIVLFFYAGLNYGIDFRGGILIEVRATQGTADLASMRTKLGGLDLGEVALQNFGKNEDVLIRIVDQGNEQANNEAVDAVRKALGDSYEFRRVEVVGPKVGGELIQAGALAAILAMLGIAVYVWFRFEWQFAIVAFVTTLHDVVTTIGVFALTQIDFNLATVAAVLTIAGYSINDTVVVFDRIRESLRKYKTMPLPELMDRAVNDTLSRTLMTSATTFIAVLALTLVGGEVIRSFTIAMLWGIVIGTFSSIFIAAPMLLLLPPPRATEPAAAKAMP